MTPLGRTSTFASALTLAFGLAAGCYRNDPRPTYPPPGYYPQQPGYYPQQPYPQQPYPQQPYPQQPYPPQPPPPQPPPPQPQGSNPWLDLLTQVISNPPPIPAGWLPVPPGPQPPAPAPTTPPGPTPPGPTPPGTVPPIEPRALDLANAINRYRQQNGLAPIPISRSLSHVAGTHARDLRDSPRLGPECNGHSWSNKGPWSSCCYTADHAQAKCMWNKPAELTPLKATGFEVALGQPGVATGVVLDSAKAIAAWQGSALHNDVLLNRNTWQKVTWRAMGAGIVDSHATAWFSDQTDPVQ